MRGVGIPWRRGAEWTGYSMSRYWTPMPAYGQQRRLAGGDARQKTRGASEKPSKRGEKVSTSSENASESSQNAATKLPLNATPPSPIKSKFPPNQPAPREKPAHLLRHLLRECTYLPDPQACQYLAKHILSRFKKYAPKPGQAKGSGYSKRRIVLKLDEARTKLNILRRTNEGETKPLLKVLLTTYGRIGKRRRELLDPLLLNEAGELVTAMDSETPEDGGHAASKRPTNNPLPPALHRLLQSQIDASPPSLTRANPRRLRPNIPDLNAYRRPMPESRRKNMMKDWYADLLARALPPLPAEEFEHLYRLARGEDLPPLPIPRRTPASSLSAKTKRDSVLDVVVARGKIPERMIYGNREGHALTPRFMQRLWQQVFVQCVCMDWDAAGQRWEITWGGQVLHALASPEERLEAEESLLEGDEQEDS